MQRLTLNFRSRRRPHQLHIVFAGLLSLFLFTCVIQAQDYIWTTNNDDTLILTGYIGNGGAVEIPSNVAGLVVTSIGSNVFYGCTNLMSVSIPFGVTNIGENAFRSCYNMSRADIPDSILNIGDRAFRYCSNLSWAVIGNSVTNIGIGAFASSIIPEIHIPSNVQNISSGAFQYCSNLTSVSIANGVQNIGHYVFEYCVSLSDINIPNSVTNIGSFAFRSCTNLTSIRIGDGVLRIWRYAFSLCENLATVTIGNHVATMDHHAFSYCPNLLGVYFRSNAPVIGTDIFISSDNVVINYMADTSGWPPVPTLWADRPTSFWLPKAQIDNDILGQSGQFGFNVDWSEGKTVVIEASTNLLATNWVSVATNTLTNSTTYFSDPQWAGYWGRFYRLRSQ